MRAMVSYISYIICQKKLGLVETLQTIRSLLTQMLGSHDKNVFIETIILSVRCSIVYFVLILRFLIMQ